MNRAPVQLAGNPVRIVILIFIAFLAAACTQQYAVRPVGIDRYKVALVQVTSELPDADEEVKKLTSMVVDALHERHLYQYSDRDQRASREQRLFIKLDIVRIDRAGNAERISAVGAGRSNEVTALASLSDNETGELVSSFRIKGISPERRGIRIDWPWGSVEKALQRISLELARQLSEWAHQDSRQH